MSVSRLACGLAIVMILTNGCAWYEPLRAKQVVTRDAYQSANEREASIPEQFATLSAEQLAAQKGRPIRTFSALLLIDDAGTMRDRGPGPFGSRAELADALAARLTATLSEPTADGGTTTEPIQLGVARVSELGGWPHRLADALAAPLVQSVADGGTDLILFSRAERIDATAVQRVERLRDPSGNPVCVHLVTIGDTSACFELRDFASCGSAVRDLDIATPETMAAYAVRLFYGDPPDSDGDGVEDYRDRCPQTRPGTRVNWDGCPFDEAALLRLLPQEVIQEGRALPPPSSL